MALSFYLITQTARERLRLHLDVEGIRRVDVFPMVSLQRDNRELMQSG